MVYIFPVVGFICSLLWSFSIAVKFIPPEASPDHQAHSKPGGPYFAVDWDEDGIHQLRLDASQSHTHYFSHGPPAESGTIVRYEWFSLETQKLLLNATSPFLNGNFYVGVTRLKLDVIDSTGDKAEAYTFVKIRQPFPGESEKPIVTSITPPGGGIAGGTVVNVYGSGFYNHPYVYFNGKMMEPAVKSRKHLQFTTPRIRSPQGVEIFVTTGFGTSAGNILFEYTHTSNAPIKFQETYVKKSDGKPLDVAEVTVIKLGPDAQYYLGTRDGYLHVLRLDRTLTVRERCNSGLIGTRRSVLGIALHPGDFNPPTVYVSTSTLYWEHGGTGETWDNGKVEIWRKTSDSCLSKVRTLIRGLPVSKGDHGVNALEFLSDGKLLIAVGGSTNAGVHTHDDKLGGLPETPLSGAILVADALNSSFDGNIMYKFRESPAKATVISGSVYVYAAGLRNVYGMTAHTNGHVFAMDNGPNSGRGFAATDCGKYGAQVGFHDKLLAIHRGAYYGHPNWNRGRFDPRQCKYVSGDSEQLNTRPLITLPSSTNGIIEYTANSFGAQLRGFLFLSKLAWSGSGVLKIAKPSTSGMHLAQPIQDVWNESGLSIVQGAYGEILMPKLKQARILALVPDEPGTGIHIIAVIPRRGPAAGGNVVLVTGRGLVNSARVFFDGLECVTTRAGDGSSLRCRVPRWTGDDARRFVSVTVKVNGVESSAYGMEYEYMQI